MSTLIELLTIVNEINVSVEDFQISYWQVTERLLRREMTTTTSSNNKQDDENTEILIEQMQANKKSTECFVR